MTDAAVRQLAVDLECGPHQPRTNPGTAPTVPPEAAQRRELGALLGEALDAYTNGRQRQAWAVASVAAAVAEAWIDRPARLWPRRLVLREAALETRARALALLGLIEADEGRKAAADELERDSREHSCQP